MAQFRPLNSAGAELFEARLYCAGSVALRTFYSAGMNS